MQGVCEMLDDAANSDDYRRALQLQRDKCAQPQLLPAASLLGEMQDHDESFAAQSLRHSRSHQKLALAVAAVPEVQAQMNEQAVTSIELQQRKDSSVNGSFESYLASRLSG
jgi:glutamate--cysteine ligase